jgi:hypothetical protein
MPPLRTAELLSREEVAAYSPCQRVYLKYPGADRWHERILAVRGSLSQDWIVITPTLDGYEEDIRAAGVEGYVAGAWGGLFAPLRTLRVFRFNEVDLGEHWETLRADVTDIAERIAAEDPTAASLPRLLLFGPRREAPLPLPPPQVPLPPLPLAPPARRLSERTAQEAEGRSGRGTSDPQAPDDTTGVIAVWPATEAVEREEEMNDDEIDERLAVAEREDERSRLEDLLHQYGEVVWPWPDEQPGVVPELAGHGGAERSEPTGAGEGLTTLEGAASGGGGGYRGRGRGRG